MKIIKNKIILYLNIIWNNLILIYYIILKFKSLIIIISNLERKLIYYKI